MAEPDFLIFPEPRPLGRAPAPGARYRSFQTDIDRIEPGRASPSTDAPLFHRLFSDPGEARSLLTRTSWSALATQRDWGEFSDYLANASVALQSGCRVIEITETNVKVPRGTALATGGWLAEGGTASASDMGVTAYTVTPARLTVFSEVSAEAFEDSGLVARRGHRSACSSGLGELLDSAVSRARARQRPAGMRDLAGSAPPPPARPPWT